MSDKPTTHTVYQSRTPAGAVRRQVVGLAVSGTGGALAVGFAALVAGGIVPKAGDRLKDGAGKWWAVTAVGDVAEGAQPLTCEPAKEGDK